jgi:hypothetical protein
LRIAPLVDRAEFRKILKEVVKCLRKVLICRNWRRSVPSRSCSGYKTFPTPIFQAATLEIDAENAK